MSKSIGAKQGKSRFLSSNDISLFCSQVVLILRSAIPLQEGIGAIGENMETEQGKELIHKIAGSLEQNSSLYTALTLTGVFPEYMVNMVNLGEKTGKLESVMEALSLYYARDDRLRRRVRSAILYPLILVLMMAAVISVMLIKVLPVFNDVFLDLGGDVSATSKAVIQVGTAVGQYSLVAVLVLAILLLVLFVLSRTDSGSKSLSEFTGRFGPTRRLSDKIASARFASVLSMMLSSGYDTAEALELIPSIISNRNIMNKIIKSRKALESGDSLSKALGDVNLFPGIYSSMIHLGSKTGSLDTVMNKLADIYSEEVDDSINKAVSVIEPVLVAALSVVIGGILLSVMLPLMGIMSSIG
jgi:type IV pilus assembly protein PilC